ncbi:MAG: hypothetical protein GY801_22270 [bacterium]|nr:hypothetical protein [bacterium]
MCENTKNQDFFYFNGINGATGKYLLSEMTPEQISKIVQGETLEKEHLQELKWYYQRTTQANLGPKEGVDPKNLAETGWGVIFADDADLATREALSELLDLRRKQAGYYYREYSGSKGYRQSESKTEFLARHGAGPGPADPENVPYYLLIVGDPETIPYRFQYQLNVQYAVGRIYFGTPEEYAQYAHSVVEAETGKVSLPRQAVFFGVRNPDDRATNLSADNLVRPLAENMAQNQPDWDVQTFLKDQATKVQLGKLLSGDRPPALLFTASHGMGFPNGYLRQLPHQGALLCQDWPGPLKWKEPIPEDYYFSADDVDYDARLLGLLVFHFACYSAGTSKERNADIPHAFVAQMPQRLLGRGALAVVGHVEQAWGYSSSMWDRAGQQLAVFGSTLRRLMEGHPVGSALEYFSERYAELSTVLSSELEDMKFGKKVNDLTLSGIWMANNDARSYMIIGDPAVRLPITEI